MEYALNCPNEGDDIRNIGNMDKSLKEVSDVISTYIYRQTFTNALPNYGYSTAVGLFKSLVGGGLVILCNWASKKIRGRGIL